MKNFLSETSSESQKTKANLVSDIWKKADHRSIFASDVNSSAPGQHKQLPTESVYFNNKFSYLPVEFFKYSPEHYFSPPDPCEPVTEFLSSGTTSDNRSRSLFSAAGLKLYRQGSKKAFSGIMSNLLGNSWSNITGLSLVPDVTTWPSSSLAQMVSWLSKDCSLIYCNDSSQLQKALERNNGKPVWIFGTAFHFVNLFDEGLEATLHPKSVILETGGTKGKSREISPGELYQLISSRFQISTDRIVSEYGMCELASQAYSWVVQTDDSGATQKRQFRFPSWVQCFVEDENRNLQTSGKGCLTVYDPLRIDYPWPIRTQDLVTLNDDQSFLFEHRIKTAPLKGCSLNAEKDLAMGASSKRKARPRPNQVSLCRDQVILNAKNIVPEIIDFLSSRQALEMLSLEFNSLIDAKSILGLLTASIPKDPDHWWQIAKSSQPSFTNWLFIPPNNHSIAMIYPITVAVVSGLKVWVRTSKSNHNLINTFVDRLKEVSRDSVQSLSPNTIIGSSMLPDDIEATFIYGHDKTIQSIRSGTNLHVQGFGDSLAISIIDSKSLLINSEQILEDVFSTQQTGCMSSRLLFVQGDADDHVIKDFFVKAEHFVKIRWPEGHDLSTKYGINHERARHQFILKSKFTNESNYCLLGSYNAPYPCKSSFIGNAPFTLPVVTTTESAEQIIANLTSLYKNLKLIMIDQTNLQALKKLFPRIEFRAHGEAQAPEWDGKHEGRPLFLTDFSEIKSD